MAEFKVLRSFAGNARGSKVDLTKADADVLLAGDRPYVEAVGGAKKAAKPRKRAAKKAAKPRKRAAKKAAAPEAPSES